MFYMLKNLYKSVYLLILILTGIQFFFSCTAKKSQITFRDYTKESGLYDLVKGMNAHSVATGDINNDGYVDVFIGNFANHNDSAYNHRGHPAYPAADKLLINNKGLGFTEVSPSPTEIKGVSSGAAFADFDNDGNLDLISSHLSFYGDNRGKSIHKGKKNYLFRNDSTGKMTDVTAGSNLDYNYNKPSSARNTFVLDYDGDGLIDLLMQEDDVWEWSVGHSKLMRNKGNMVFEDVTQKAGLPAHFYGLGGFVGDINGDTWPDIFFAHSSELYVNNKNGTFTKSSQKFVEEDKKVIRQDGNYDWTCGANIGDLNGDGLLDIVMGDHFKKDTLNHKIAVFINKGNDGNNLPVFENVSDKVGIKTAPSKEPHINIDDLDNDGDMDILVSSRDNFIYTNTGYKNGLPIFAGASKSNAPPKGLNYWPGGALFDFDRDGRLDFIAPQWFAYETSPLLKNVTANNNTYLSLKLDLAPEKNRNGIGAILKIYKPGKIGIEKDLLGIKVITVSHGYSSGTAPEVHFGTAKNKKVDISIQMPCNGNSYQLKDVKTGQYLLITNELLTKKQIIKINYE